jgi:tRNA (adenine22-N1)-methyltransferase
MNSFRLKTLHSYYQREESIWDIGCDHGLLGLSFSDIETVKQINLVDPSEPVIDVLKKKIKDSYISITKVFIHHKEGQKLIIESKSNCIFIAGMGGKEIGLILTHLIPQLDKTSRIIISPHRKILELRSLLHTMPVSLLSEEVIEDDGQFYQIMSLRPGPGIKVSLYGDKLWETVTGKKYLDHQIRHFEAHADPASRLYVTTLKGIKS